MRFLLTNDDGIDAPGLQALWDSVQHACRGRQVETIVVAPDRGRSECGHGVTSGAKRLTEIKPGWFSVDGTPVDCVRVAIGTVVPEPTIVFSGINAGANLGVNLMVSGTFAAAREAAAHQIPSMAISHYRRPGIAKTWAHTPHWLESTLCEFIDWVGDESQGDSASALWNVNLPAIDPKGPSPTIHRCDVDPCPIERTAFRDGDIVNFELDFHNRARAKGTDVDCCFAGQLTISELTPNFPSKFRN